MYNEGPTATPSQTSESTNQLSPQPVGATQQELLERAKRLLEQYVLNGKNLTGGAAATFERECICTVALISDRLGLVPFQRDHKEQAAPPAPVPSPRSTDEATPLAE